MEQTQRQEIISLIVDQLRVGAHEVVDDVDINRGLGCTGDDFHELMVEFEKKFAGNMEGYLWYFHTEEEGSSGPGGWFFKPPNERVVHIPVTLRVLMEAASIKRWSISYPAHGLPTIRWDLWINAIVIVLFLAWAITSC